MLASPSLVLVLGAALIPFLRGRWRSAWMLLLPVAALALLWWLPEGSAGTFQLLGLTLEPIRVDALSRVFAAIFLFAAFFCVIYGWHLRDAVQQTTMLLYAGATVGGSLAGDLLTLFVYWEIAGLSSVFLIWSRRTERSLQAGLRYLAVQVTAGVLLLAGIVLRAQEGHGIAFDFIGTTDAGGWLILLAIGIKCAFPILHAWLQDTYPEATIVGTVVLSAFTTKLAVYALLRGFEGTSLLIWVGAIMTCFPIFYAVIENDLRRVLAYSLINQLGFMVVGAGIGGALGVNGAVSHAFAHIIYKALLFMAMGAVLYRVGTVKGSELGGLYKSMPQTAAMCIVGAASISALPLFSGFTTKSMVMEATGQEHLLIIWLMLLFASAGVFHHAGIKVPYFAFFAHDRGHRVQEAPLNMRIAMAIAALACIVIGVYPQVLYELLPHPVEYVPYTTGHVINQLQLLVLAALAFTLLVRTGIYPPELRSVNLDTDWIYRQGVPVVARSGARQVSALRAGLVTRIGRRGRDELTAGLLSLRSRAAAPWSTGVMVWWVTMLLGLYLVLALR